MLIAAMLVSPSSVIAPPHTRSGADENETPPNCRLFAVPFPRTLAPAEVCRSKNRPDLMWLDSSVDWLRFCWISQANRMCRWPFGHKGFSSCHQQDEAERCCQSDPWWGADCRRLMLTGVAVGSVMAGLGVCYCWSNELCVGLLKKLTGLY